MSPEEKRAQEGKLFRPGDPELAAMKARAHRMSLEYSATGDEEGEKRAAILQELLGALGEGSSLSVPLMFHYGKHTFIGKRFFGGFGLTVQDDGPVTIGDDCNFGPNVTIVTPLHPMLPKERRHLLGPDGQPAHVCWARPVTIGSDCWLGANVTVCPGVTIGEGCVIGAGSVVTRDIPPLSFAAGNPCRVIRSLTEADSMVRRPELLGEYSLYPEEE